VIIKYRGWNIERNLKPIPCRLYDYDLWHDDYDGATDGDDDRYDFSESEDSAKKLIDDYYLEINQ